MTADRPGTDDVRLAGNADRARIADMLARAFADDIAYHYIFPDSADRLKRLPRLFRILFDDDGGPGMRLVTAGGEAATLWRAPGNAASGTLALLRHAWPLWRALGTAAPRGLRVSGAIEAHFPDHPFWYLHIAGCDPDAQGRGFGGAAVRAGLERVAGRHPVYLETAKEANIGFYRSLGFAVTGDWCVGRDGPRFWSMLRSSS